MRLNVFAGARRIALLIAILWGIGALVVTWLQEPVIELRYTIAWPGESPVRTSQDCQNEEARKWKRIRTARGTPIDLALCFKAKETREEKGDAPWLRGAILIPYRVEPQTGHWWGAAPHSSEVSAYTQRAADDFTLAKTDQEWADEQYWPARSKQMMVGVGWLIGGWIVLWIATFVIGWIVRGFAGIPMGKDAGAE